ncbi:Tyrosyl-tRNA synthetase [Liberibacter crescens BT-1]|uniref:Tyrosine--tRNA ligase n=1 Tax=Liberibacter crescens (strain BT-1) TaxID=1215343 RepID=L0EUD6_LIBCB|nr:tyrosine--tRNA ligase [Liberibacter crescens]AGA64562.1 Tyrosyl-tRNA synthetase [Liberibacter crescens BT-1]AMC12705.1 tyrosyl-tRNA synthetase [Liberibacter crescens]
MYELKSDFLKILCERGFIHQISHEQELDKLLYTTRMTAYIGYDPTASSLHVGHMMQLMMLYWLQTTGHKPISLMGGGTGLIGDPSFKDEARQLLTVNTVQSNISSIQRIFSQFLQYGDGATDALMVNNIEWLTPIKYLDFLRDIGCHFSINRMLSFDSVKLRLQREQSLSFLEFNYMILQAYDFVELAKRYDCRLQMGGSDQWGNIINGVDLGHRLGLSQLFALTSPLLVTSSGKKMGKTDSGTIWLDQDLTSIYDFWQYWRNTDDADVARFLKVFTTLSLEEINRLSKLKGSEINEAKKILATEITAKVHGRKMAEQAAEAAFKVFEEGTLSHGLPTINIPMDEFNVGIGLLNLIVRSGLAPSNNEARRQVKSNAVKINDQLIVDDRLCLGPDNYNPKETIKLSVGKKHHVIINFY